MKLAPSVKECSALLAGHVPPNIIAHSEKVAEVALLISGKLKARGEKVNLRLVEAAALLHDLDKMETLSLGGKHGAVAAERLEGMGYDALARVVRVHVLESVLPGSSHKPKTWEEKIVYYADKRVKHDKIVSLRDRLDDLVARYGAKFPGSVKSIKASEPHIIEMERELMEAAGMKAGDIR